MPTFARPNRNFLVALFVLAALAAPAVQAQWVEYTEETNFRISAPAALTTTDDQEKDYAWGDFDKDGDIDLVIARKSPFTSAGKLPNVLLMNEGGVLTDRTATYASASDVLGDDGFLTPTNDRDIVVVDVDNDTWLDLVTAVTISDGDSKAIGHPRVYYNLGENAGSWLGFRYEEARIPTMLSFSGQSGFNPRFCSMGVGDVTGDGYVDIWFGDYDSSGAGGISQPAGADFNDRLLVNNGAGTFTDDTNSDGSGPVRFSGTISIPGSANTAFPVSAFGAAGAIADMNGDGVRDIVKQTALNPPQYVGIGYNDPGNVGFFDTFEVVNQSAPYFISVDDLNRDGKPDIVVVDDGADRYLINQGNGADGLADFTSFVFSYDQAGDDGFGGNSFIADLDNDGWNDVLITDVDVDIGGCDRRTHIYRNLGGTIGSNVTLQEQTTGTNCNGSSPNCQVASIPADMLQGTHDIAVFDINGDNWKDLVIGRCDSTEVWMNVPPTGLRFQYPQGLPAFVVPGQPTTFTVKVNGIAGGQNIPNTGRFFASVNGAPFTEIPLVDIGAGELYEATLPAVPACADDVRFYFSSDELNTLQTFYDPPTAPTNWHTAIGAIGSQITLEDNIEGDVSGWTIINDASLTAGGWEQAEPNGTLTGGGDQAAPDEDAQAQPQFTKAFVTQNGPQGGSVGADDVDGGPTDLISPPIDLAGTDATITYSRWFYTSGDDELSTWVSGDGSSWVQVENTVGTNATWQVSSFRVGDYITPTATTQVRFRAADSPNNNITEAGIDLFRVTEFICGECVDDIDCANGTFCDGAETCDAGSCVAGSDPCPGQICDEGGEVCVDCLVPGDCDDGVFCNGAEDCVANSCVAGSDPCPTELCDEVGNACVQCLGDPDCDDGVFCNGAETCVSGVCITPSEACPGQLCDEGGNVCLGNVQLQPKPGQPLLGLTQDQLDRFTAGKAAFERTFSDVEGLGPVFNQNSCASCHNNPVGGSGSITVTRFGFNDDKGGGFDPLDDLGGTLRQAEAIRPECAEVVPAEANVTTLRLTNSALGFGLVEAITDADLLANETTPPPGVSGAAHMVEAVEAPGVPRVGRFGWKSQVPTMLTFSADATLNEMGITNQFFGTENDPNGVNAPTLGAPDNCDTVADPEDVADVEGVFFIERVTDFQRFLAPPPQTPRSGMSGESVFNTIGCASCHISSFTTEDNPALEDAIRNKLLKPYSDFLVHDMGLNADFIPDGTVTGRELRTSPLWGVRLRDPLWHDGRVAGGTFTSRMTASIGLHDSLGSEGIAAAQAFTALPQVDKDALIAFLDSLGRCEFDMDGDNTIDPGDFVPFQNCYTGSGPYTADDACAISDVDQDGDVDDDDFTLLVAAGGGFAGEIPNGADVPGIPLTVARVGNDIRLDWDDSCAATDTDYQVYEGTIAAPFDNHLEIQCSTAGAKTHTLTPVGTANYYLVTSSNDYNQGSYGRASNGTDRAVASNACLPQLAANVCP